MTFPHHFVSLDVKTHADHFAQAIAQGLTAAEKTLPLKYLYATNARDSRLFERLTRSDRCYMTQAEDTLLTRFAPRIVQQLKDNTALVNLGGQYDKQTRSMSESLLRKQGRLQFAPIDIAGDFLSHSIQLLQHDYPDLGLLGVIADYPAGLNVLNQTLTPRLLLWLGSDISHVEYAEAARLLRENMVAELKPGDRLLLGIDLKKPEEVLHAAYGRTDRDSAVRKVSLAFARHALRRINRELQADFAPENFDYYCHYNPVRGCMQIYLRSTCPQQAHIASLGVHVGFARDEYILIHESYKYSLEDIRTLVDATGLKLEQQWVDNDTLYSLNLLMVDGSESPSEADNADALTPAAQ